MREAPDRFSAESTCTSNDGITVFWVVYGKAALGAHASNTGQSAPGPLADKPHFAIIGRQIFGRQRTARLRSDKFPVDRQRQFQGSGLAMCGYPRWENASLRSSLMS